MLFNPSPFAAFVVVDNCLHVLPTVDPCDKCHKRFGKCVDDKCKSVPGYRGDGENCEGNKLQSSRFE